MTARVLVIEDNEENMELMEYLLGSAGYIVSLATDGAAGFETAKRESPELILCDLRMPVLDGFAVARLLKADASLAGTRLVAVTAFASDTDREQALAAGFDEFVTKPIEPDDFLRQVDELLQRPRGAEAV